MRQVILTLFLIAFLPFAIQLFLLIRDRKKNKAIPVKFSVLKLIPIFLAMLGYVMYAVSWVELPMIGKLSFLTLLSAGEGSYHFRDTLLIYAVLIFFSFGLIISATFFQLIFKITIKSIPTLIYEVLLGLTSTVLGAMTINHMYHIFDQPTPGTYGDPTMGLGQLFQELIPVSIGMGLVVITSIGLLYAGFVLFMQRRNVLSLKKTTSPFGEYDQLRELKKLLDEGVITQEEFDRKKTETLK